MKKTVTGAICAALAVGVALVSIAEASPKPRPRPAHLGAPAHAPAADGEDGAADDVPDAAGAAVEPPPADATAADAAPVDDTAADDLPADLPEAATGRGSATNMPVPRYVSLKGSEGNVRRGPSFEHRIDWVFRHRAMPLRVVAEFGHWRRVEDNEGQGGWIHYSLLSGVRTVLVTEPKTELHARGDTRSEVVAVAGEGVIGRLEACTRDWCEIDADGEDGWVEKARIWGVDPGEIRD